MEVFPNPVNTTATIRFNLSRSGQVRLDIYSIDGKLISTLVDHQLQAGDHQVEWNPEDTAGHFIVKLTLAEGSIQKEYVTKIQVL